MKRLHYALAFALLPLLVGCPAPQSSKPTSTVTSTTTALPAQGVGATISFQDVTKDAGIAYAWKLPQKPVCNILDMIGNGCAFLDYDNDGNLDILLVGPKLALYKGDGKGHFTDVTQAMGLAALSGHFLGCATGDINNDGFTDIYITAYRGGVLLQNEGGERFIDVTKRSGIAAQPFATSATFADLDSDGNTDLFIGNYVKFGPEILPQLCVQKGIQTACAPRQYKPEPCFLYHGNGKGQFIDVTKASGFTTLSGKALGATVADYDHSGRLSLAVANDEMPGDLMKNMGGGKFKNIASLAGTATDNEGNMHGGMGTDWGDIDNDGKLDLFVATYQNESKNIYHNDGDDLFTDKALALNLISASPYVTFGARLVDFDNDGLLDIAMANGHVQDNIEKIDARTTFRQPSAFYHATPTGNFEEVTANQPKEATRAIMGRGLAAGDFDNDGKIDLLIVDSNGAPLLLHNETKNAGHFIGVSLHRAGNKSTQGAIVTAKIGTKTRLRHAHTDGSYMSASDPRVIIGLGDAQTVDTLTVTWPDGKTTTQTNLPADKYLNVSE